MLTAYVRSFTLNFFVYYILCLNSLFQFVVFNQKGNEIIFYAVAFCLPVDIIQANHRCARFKDDANENHYYMPWMQLGCGEGEMVRLDWLEDSLFMKMFYM